MAILLFGVQVTGAAPAGELGGDVRGHDLKGEREPGRGDARGKRWDRGRAGITVARLQNASHRRLLQQQNQQQQAAGRQCKQGSPRSCPSHRIRDGLLPRPHRCHEAFGCLGVIAREQHGSITGRDTASGDLVGQQVGSLGPPILLLRGSGSQTEAALRG